MDIDNLASSLLSRKKSLSNAHLVLIPPTAGFRSRWGTQRNYFFLVLLLLLSLSFPLSSSAKTEPTPCPKEWAQAIQKPGLPNFHKVTENLYRGAQPTAAGFKELKQLGIKTVVNLRAEHDDRKEIGALDLPEENIPMVAWNPRYESYVRFLKIVTDPKRAPVFVHCQRGADRTGSMVVVYRLAVCGWSKSEAIAEMTRGGFGFNSRFQNLIQFIEKLDLEKLKQDIQSPE